MRQRYRRQSMSAWIFWAAMVVGGTLYGAYRFDWFSVAFVLPQKALQNAADAKNAVAEKPHEPLPTDGQIEVAQNSVGPQTEPPPTEIEEPVEKTTKARLLEQRAEPPEPKIHANAAIPSAAEPVKAVHIEVNPVPAATAPVVKATVAEVSPSAPMPAATKPVSPFEKPRSKSNVVQAVSFNEEKEVPPSDPDLEARIEKVDQYLQNSDLLRAHRELSSLYWAKPHWRPAIKERIERTANAIYFDSQPQFLQPYVVKPNDQLAVFAKKYNVPWEYLAKLNHVDAKKIQPRPAAQGDQGSVLGDRRAE